MKRRILLATLIVGAAHAADISPQDQEFFMKAAAGGMAEVAAGKLAQTKGASPEVRDFGAMMVKDHTKANEKLKSIAQGKNVTLPTEPDAKHKATQQKLEALSGSAFDRAYVEAQVADHEATASLLERQIDAGQDPDARAFAQETLPTVSAHLATVRELSTQLSGPVSRDRP